jgi:hypothetical protein
VTLEDFVRDSLAQIVRGAVAANDEIGIHSAGVNPRPNHRVAEDSGGYWSGSAPAYPVDFDVAVTATSEAGSQGKVGVVAGVFGVGGGINESDSASRVSRLRFRLYLALPVTEPTEDKRKAQPPRPAKAPFLGRRG